MPIITLQDGQVVHISQESYDALKKETLSSIEGKRDVERWNTLREEAKLYYPKEVIYQLDASGFIHQWLRDEFHISNNG